MTRPARSFHVGSWLVQPSLNRISGQETSSRVEPKVMDVLIELARNPGEVVTREELLNTVWEGTVVTDDVLTRSISELRKVFRDDRRSPSYIETIPKTGYRLVAPVMLESRGDRVPDSASVLEIGTHGSRVGRRQRIIPWVGAALVVIALGFLWIQRSSFTGASSYHSETLTSYPGSERFPALSPDGKQVAFSWDGEAGENVDVYVKLVNGEARLRLTESEDYDFRPTWSPDGTQIVFVRWSDACSIRIVSALGGPSKELMPCGNTIYADPAWSPDGRWIALNNRASSERPFAIELVSPRTLERRRLTEPPVGIWGDHDPSFSPDGRRVGFTRSASEGMQDLFVIDVDGKNEVALTEEAKNIWGSTWAGNETIVFSSNRTGRAALWRVDVSDRTLDWIGVAADETRFPSYAGARLAFEQASVDVNIWHVPVSDSSLAKPLISSTRWDMHPQYSPDRSQIAFTSNRSGTYEIWIADSTGRNAVKLTEFNGPFTSSPKWSPDGRQIVFTSRPSRQADIYVVSAGGGLPKQLTSEESDELAPSWSRDGRSVYFSSNRTGRWEIYRLDIESGAVIEVTKNGGLGPQQSDEGSLFYAKPGRPGIWRFRGDEDVEEQIVDGLDTRDWGSWHVSSGKLVYLKRARPTAIMRHELQTGNEDTLFVPPKRVPGGDPAIDISTDGSYLLFGQVDRSESDLMIVEGFGSR